MSVRTHILSHVQYEIKDNLQSYTATYYYICTTFRTLQYNAPLHLYLRNVLSDFSTFFVLTSYLTMIEIYT